MRLSRKSKVKVGIGAALIALILAIALFGSSLPGFSLLSGFQDGSSSRLGDWEVLQERSFLAREVRSVFASTTVDDVRVTAADVDEVRVVEEVRLAQGKDAPAPTDVAVEDGALRVEAPEGRRVWSLFGFLPGASDGSDYKGQRRYTVEVPRELAVKLGKVGVQATAGEVEVEGISCEELSLGATSGTLAVAADARRAHFQLTSGEVSFEGSVADKLECDGTSASAKLVCRELPATTRVQMVSGGAEVAVPEAGGFTVRLETTSSSFTSDLDLTSPSGDADDDAMGEKVYRYGDGAAEMLFDVTSGSVHLARA